jgi:uncharacterized protein
VVVTSGVFRREDLGLTWKQRPGTLRAVLFVVIPVVIIIDLTVLRLAPHESFTAEDVAYQLTMPGLVEELFYRGLLLALFDSMFAPRVTILGTKMGYGAIVTSLAFGAVHAIDVDCALRLTLSPLAAVSPLISAFFAAWIRARSGSLVIPILAHNLSNTLVTVARAIG